MTTFRKDWKFDTTAIHAGYVPDPATRSRAVPVHRTTSYVFDNTEHASRLFSLKEMGHLYSRLTNPTTEVLEERMAVLDGGVGAVAFASGTSAVFGSLINIVQAGEEFISTSNLYGGTYTMFNDVMPQLGITVRFVKSDSPDRIREALNDRTRAIYLEAVGNPNLGVPDFEAIAKVAADAHVPLIVDSTFTTPYIFRALDAGANIVVHSLTKWIGGHGTAMGGIVVDGGSFDWSDGKFRQFNESDQSYFGLRFGHDLGELGPMAYSLRLRLVMLRNIGPCLSADNAWMFLQGLETLALRMERHCGNALRTARFLSEHPRVKWVNYPGLESDPSHAMAGKYFRDSMAGGVVVFGIKGSAPAGARFINNLQLFSHLANVGDAKSLAIHPASTTHSQLTEGQQVSAGVGADLIRLSIGIEHIDDILADLEQALERA